jgi:hypothetical protein
MDPIWLYLVAVAILFFGLSNYFARKETEKKLLKARESLFKEAQELTEAAQEKAKLYKKSLLERSAGFPSLVESIEKYEKLIDENKANYLTTKAHPARKSSELLREEASRRRQAERESRQLRGILEYYENLAPFLADYKNELIPKEEEEIFFSPLTPEERGDPLFRFLTKDEYRKLSSIEKNQLALDRFWARKNKSKWLIGRLYERYIGYLYEKDGYDVEYVGAIEGLKDLGRDLVCKKNNEICIIQCKYWSEYKTIHEKHVFQFFGTVYKYKSDNPTNNVRAIFYTNIALSDLARKFAKDFGLELMEHFHFDPNNPKYPTIKCNISKKSGEKIYHLPLDQQYDTSRVETARGEYYCDNVSEAEGAGFRRAWRWRGD